MSHPAGLATLLSQALVAFTIEFDNEFEQRMVQTWARPFRTSLVMWSNFMRFVPDRGVTLGEVAERSRIALKALASVAGGMERWGYLAVDRVAGKGFGTASGVKAATTLRPKATGTLAREKWEPLAIEVEDRWKDRLGAERVESLRAALTGLVDGVDVALPHFLPVVTGGGLFAAPQVETAEGAAEPDSELPALLSRVLLAFTLDCENDADVSLPVGSNVLRVLSGEPMPVKELPLAAGVSKEAVSVSLTWLERQGYVEVASDPAGRGKVVSATPEGRSAQEAHADRLEAVESEWEIRFGAAIGSLRQVLASILAEPGGEDGPLSAGLVPPPGGWRGEGRYRPLTAALVAAPRDGLPRYPMVLHRGGWPDGS